MLPQVIKLGFILRLTDIKRPENYCSLQQKRSSLNNDYFHKWMARRVACECFTLTSQKTSTKTLLPFSNSNPILKNKFNSKFTNSINTLVCEFIILKGKFAKPKAEIFFCFGGGPTLHGTKLRICRL